MFYLSKVYKFGKNGLIGIGGVAGIGSIVYGVLLGHISGLILIIGGSLWVVQTSIILYDNSKLLSTIKKQLLKLELDVEAASTENKRMKDLIDTEAKIRERKISELDILRAKLLGMNEKIETLEKLKDQYKKSSDDLSIMNLDLKSEVANLLSLRSLFDVERQNLKTLLEESKTELAQVAKTKELYEIEILHLQNTVGNQAKRIEDCKEQIAYLTKIYEDSREIILNMAQTSMVFDSISQSLNEGLIKIEEKDLAKDKKNDQVGYLSSFLSKVSSLVSGIVGSKGNNVYQHIDHEDDDEDENEKDMQNVEDIIIERHDHISKDDLETLLNMKDPLVEKETTLPTLS